MAARKMMPTSGGTRMVRGNSRATPAVPPSPGKTPMVRPSTSPIVIMMMAWG